MADSVTIQGQNINVQNPVSENFSLQVQAYTDKHFRHFRLPDYGKITNLTTFKPDPDVEQAIQKALKHVPDDVRAKINKYQHSSEVTETVRLIPSVAKLAEKPPKKLDREVAKRALIMRIMRSRQQIKNRARADFCPEELLKFSQNNSSSAGIVPNQQIMGTSSCVTGKKGEFFAAAVTRNTRDRIIDTSPPPCLPYKPFRKSEVQSVDKPVRGIQNESLPNYMVLSMTEPKEKSFKYGNAIGMGGPDNDYQILFNYWYVMCRRYKGFTWLEFIDFLRKQGIHESDKKGWEASTNVTDGLPNAIFDIATKIYPTEGDKRVYIRAYSDYACPLIYYDGWGFFAPWRVGSGTYKTSSGNTERHRTMNDYMCYHIHHHNFHLSRVDCDCECCKLIGQDVPVDPMLYRLRRQAFIQGDDYISVSFGIAEDKVFDRLVDFIFGTTTKTEHKQFEHDAEFLRRRFYVCGEDILSYKESSRAIAKLVKGEHRRTINRFVMAALSAKIEVGINETANEFINQVLAELVCKVDSSIVDEEQRYKRYGDVGALLLSHKFSVIDVVNYRNRPLANLLRALEDI